MAKIKVEEVLDHLEHDLRRALEATLEEHFQNQSFDARAVFRTFKRQAYRKCNNSENVPDRYVEKE